MAATPRGGRQKGSDLEDYNLDEGGGKGCATAATPQFEAVLAMVTICNCTLLYLLEYASFVASVIVFMLYHEKGNLSPNCSM